MTGHGYWTCTDTRNQAAAKAVCETVGGTLVQVGDMAENDFLDTNTTGSDSPWIGGEDRADEGTWVWADGSTFYEGSTSVLYTNWNSGEPNDSSNEDCIQLIPATGLWNDAKCGDSHGYWCEVP